MLNKIPRFYSSESDFKVFHHELKHLNCPFCRTIGNLILHGFLYGYDKKRRGRRIFCSKRNKRKGCGRTCSLLKAGFLKHFRLKSSELWIFIDGLIQGLSKQAAWIKNGLTISESFLYGLSRRLKVNEPYIKTKLYSLNPSSIKKTFIKLRESFACSDPISAFQLHFQDDFLKTRVYSPTL